ncbi:unnamed protein product [Durusdinium trenchii]|uniref:Uncharacterized protein n=1 Tax=Durusdinium trenchii TaxID=1381693 RepID=A0ABP0JKR4_9DINO
MLVQDFGRRFGRWGAAACPDLKDIIADVESGAKVASGGKSGTSPLRSSKFVVKLIDPIEHKMLHHLLHKLKGSRHFEHQAVANPLNTRDENGN